MQQSSRYILFAGLCIGSTSILYFFSLLLHSPFILTVALVLLSGIFIFRWMPEAHRDTDKTSMWLYAVLVFALYSMVDRANAVALKHGEWDAWAIWNYHAAFLQSPANWKNMLPDRIAHPDYPLCLPGVLAFLHRLFAGHFSLVIPFAFSFFITLCIPVLIYMEQYKKNIVVASAALLVFATDDFYVLRGVSQYADSLLAYFFLGALVCIDLAAENKKYVTISAALLGCCMWTKNEGIILAALFTLFYAGTFFTKVNFKRSLLGFAVPLAAFLIFKILYAPPNDMVADQGRTALSQLMTHARFTMIWDSFKANLSKNFNYVKPGFYLYMLVCLVQKKWPGRQMLLLIACMLAYFMVYMLTPRELEWQLATSQDRLMHQLMPAMVYVIASKLSGIRFLLPEEQAH